jgi:hypothetical protein
VLTSKLGVLAASTAQVLKRPHTMLPEKLLAQCLHGEML